LNLSCRGTMGMKSVRLFEWWVYIIMGGCSATDLEFRLQRLLGFGRGWLPLAGGACVGPDHRVHQLCLQKAKGMLWPLGTRTARLSKLVG
jgi:hypothetical protein